VQVARRTGGCNLVSWSIDWLHPVKRNGNMDVNKHCLKREIPAAVKRTVRQACGFGCMVCGEAIYEYEHIDPEFAEAKEHSPDAIGLLCPTCHARVTRRLYSPPQRLRGGYGIRSAVLGLHVLRLWPLPGGRLSASSYFAAPSLPIRMRQ